MTSEERAVALLAAANPIPDEESLDLDPVTAQLSELTRRSSKVTELDTRRESTEEQRRNRPMLFMAAAVAVVVVGLTVFVLTQSDNQAPVVEEPVPTTAAITSTTVDQAEAAWEAIPPFTGAGPADATHRTAILSVPFSFKGAGGWNTVTSTQEKFVIELQPGPTLVHFGVLVRSGTVDETIDQFATAHEAFPDAEMTIPEAVTLAGASGMMFETVGLPTRVSDPDMIPWAGSGDEFAGHPVLGGGQGMIYVLDVNGTTVVVGYDTTPGAFDDYLDDAQAIIDSITWKDLD